MCGAVLTPPFTYTMVPNAFSFISFDPSSVEITISSASVAGSY